MVPDNRIKLPASRIDFTNDVGLTGQDHDDYPPAGGQARFDHARIFWLGLLAQQSSYEPPTQYRDGTPWFDLNDSSLKIWANGAWRPYAETIVIADSLTLADWFATASIALTNLTPDITFSGQIGQDDLSHLSIPESLRTAISAEMRCFLYINGALIDPRKCALAGTPPSTINVSNLALRRADKYTVILRRIPASTYYLPDVVAS